MDKLAKLRDLVGRLREHAPPLLPVRVYVRQRLPDDHQGWCCLVYDGTRPARFHILVRRAAWPTMKDAVLHEWAHALSWQEGELTEMHGPEWGLAYARVYQEMVEP